MRIGDVIVAYTHNTGLRSRTQVLWYWHIDGRRSSFYTGRETDCAGVGISAEKIGSEKVRVTISP